jgi:PAS domain S-box-containing protein
VTPQTVDYLEGLLEGFVAYDENWVMTYMNASAERILGRRRQEVLGKTWHQAFPHAPGNPVDLMYQRVMRTRQAERMEYDYPHYGRWLEISASAVRNGGVAVYFRDITDRKRAEHELREAGRRKDEFIATLSHELRNPLAPLRNALHLLRLSGQAGADAAPVHEMMERQLNHLVRLVDDLLESARVTRGAFELRREPVEIASAVSNALEASEAQLGAGGQRISVVLPQEALWVDGDPVRIAQILSNLLNNAARFTPRGGCIEVRARGEAGHAVLSVRDDGAGIAPEQMAHLFEMFRRDSRSAGLGIGLALARRLAEMHGGSLTAASAGPGKGAEFTVRLPLAAARQEPVGKPGMEQPADLPSSRVLVVDDNRDAADSLGMLLRFLGAEVQVAHDGREALAAFESYRPRLVLLDIGMPEMDGYEVARAIRRRDAGRSVPLVALTGWGQDEDRRRAREAGFDHHLIKPPELEALRSLLASLPRA